MKRSLCSAFAVSLVLAAAPILLAQSKAKATNVPEIAYDSVPNFFKMPPRYGQFSLQGYLTYTGRFSNPLLADSILWGGVGLAFRY